MINIFIIIVLYNKRLCDSSALKSLNAAKANCKSNISFIIIDNSTDDQIKAINKRGNVDFEYIDMNGNKGLSVAYNCAISNIEKNPYNWIVTSDQDTDYPIDYLKKMERQMLDSNKMVIAPQVYNTTGIMSPFRLRFDCFRDIKRVINSGLAIRSDVFTQIKYNEGLFLDFVDFDLSNSLFQKNIGIEVTDIKLYQDFSGTDYSNTAATQKRYEIYLNDAKKYYKFWKHSIIAKRFYVFKRTISLSLRFKSFTFFKLFITNK